MKKIIFTILLSFCVQSNSFASSVSVSDFEGIWLSDSVKYWDGSHGGSGNYAKIDFRKMGAGWYFYIDVSYESGVLHRFALNNIRKNRNGDYVMECWENGSPTYKPVMSLKKENLILNTIDANCKVFPHKYTLSLGANSALILDAMSNGSDGWTKIKSTFKK